MLKTKRRINGRTFTFNTFCATGEGGGVDPTCSLSSAGAAVAEPAREGFGDKVKREILAQASKVEFSDEKVKSAISNRDYDGIEERMESAELDEMNEALAQAEADALDRYLEHYEPNVDYDDAARESGWDTSDVNTWIEDEVHPAIDATDLTDEQKQEVKDALDEWYNQSHRAGDDAIDQARKELPDFTSDSVKEMFDQKSTEVHDAIVEKMTEMEGAEREDAARSFEYEYHESDKREYLRSFYSDNPDRFSGDSTELRNTWQKDEDDDDVLSFDTSAGKRYDITVIDRSTAGKEIRDVQFSDESGSFGITKAGSAHEVFSGVMSAMTAYATKKDSPAFTFTAKEESRRKLYNRVVKTLAKVMPEYSALSIDTGEIRSYLVVKRDRKEEYIALAKSKMLVPGAEFTPIVNQLSPDLWVPTVNAWASQLRYVTNKKKRSPRPTRVDPTRTTTLRRQFSRELKRRFSSIKAALLKLVVDEDAFGLRERKQPAANSFCPTGEGGGIDPSCSPSQGGEFFHGTSSAALVSIMKHGILPAGGKGAEAYVVMGTPTDATVHKHVFMTEHYRVAAGYAEDVQENYPGSKGIVLRVRIPKDSRVGDVGVGGDDSSQYGDLALSIDPESNPRDKGWRFRGTIPPAWIEGVVKEGEMSRNSSHLLAYVVVFVPKKDDESAVVNTFCATGEGGGIDPTCSPSSIMKTMGDIVAQDADLVSRKTTLGGKLMSPSEYHAGYYKTFPVVYRGADVESLGDHHVFISPDRELAAAHGEVVAYRLLPGATIYPDPEGIEELDDVLGGQATGWDSFKESRSAVVKQSELGPKNQPRKKEPTTNAGRYAFLTSPEKVRAFQAWIKTQVASRLRNKSVEDMWRVYVNAGLRKGAGRAFDDTMRMRPELRKEGLDFYRGSKEQFLRSSFRQPETIEKAQLLAGRSYDDLEGVTSEMSTRMSRVLTDGLVQGKNPRDIGRDLAKQVDVSEKRAQVIARTECLPADTLVDAAVVRAVFRRWYEGPMVEIVTRAGRKFSATPNHPMLSRRGWVGAGELQKGDYLVSDARQQDSSSARNGNTNHGPTTLGEIFRSLEAVGITERVACSKHDFHGDGKDGEVDIFCPDGELRIGSFAPLYEHQAQQFLSPTAFAASTFCHLCRRLFPINSRVCFCSSSQLCSRADNPLGNSAPVQSSTIGNGGDALSSSVPFGKFAGVNVGSQLVGDTTVFPGSLLSDTIAAHFCSEPADDLEQPLGIVSGSPGDFLGRDAGDVEFDEVEFVTVRQFSGHVFNLETPFGYYTIDSLYTGNTIRAHAEGQLDAMKALGVEEVGVMVEWSTAGDERVCKLCQSLEGMVLKIDEAHGMIPRHPQCRCSFVPANIGEDEEEQTRTKRGIDAAVEESLELEGAEDDEDAWGPAQDVSKERLESIIGNNALVELDTYLQNSFCPTGEGGGIDPACSPQGSSTVPVIVKVAQEKAKSKVKGKFGQIPIKEIFGSVMSYDDYSFPIAVEGKAATERKVKISDLTAAQTDMAFERVSWLIEHGNDKKPIVYRVGKKLYVKDGHHTIAAEKFKGRTSIKVLVQKAEYRSGFSPEDTTTNTGDNCGTGAGGFQPGNTCGKGSGELAKSVRVERRGEYSGIRKGKRTAGIFFTETGSSVSEYGDTLITAEILAGTKIYNGVSSAAFLEEKGLLDKKLPIVKKLTGKSTISEAEEFAFDGFDPGGKRQNAYFNAVQTVAAQVLREEGYHGARWNSEDDLNPVQYQIWDEDRISVKESK